MPIDQTVEISGEMKHVKGWRLNSKELVEWIMKLDKLERLANLNKRKGKRKRRFGVEVVEGGAVDETDVPEVIKFKLSFDARPQGDKTASSSWNYTY